MTQRQNKENSFMGLTLTPTRAKLVRGGREAKNYDLNDLKAIVDFWAENPLGTARLDATGETQLTEKNFEKIRSAHKNALTSKFGFEYPDPDNTKNKKSGVETRTEKNAQGQLILALQLDPAYLLNRGLATQEEITAAETAGERTQDVDETGEDEGAGEDEDAGEDEGADEGNEGENV